MGNAAEKIGDFNMEQAEKIARRLIEFSEKNAVIRLAGGGSESKYWQYQPDPVAFCEEKLNENYTADVQRMMQSVADNEITVAKSSNSVGKTHAAARVAVWWGKCFPNSQVYTAAAPPEGNLKRLLWGEMGSIRRSHPELFKDYSNNILHWELAPKEFITGVTIPSSGTSAQREAKFSGKHAPYLLFILDEADAIPDEVYKGIESCMTGGMVRLLCMFNPRAELGEVYRMIRDDRANVVHLSAFNHPNVKTGENKIPGAVTRAVTVRRIHEWTRPLMEGENRDKDAVFKVPKFLVGATAPKTSGKGEHPPLPAGLRKIEIPQFSYMVLGQYPPAGVKQLISKEWINAARLRWDQWVNKMGETRPEGIMGIQGLDAAEFGDDWNCSYVRYGGYLSRPQKWQKVDTLITGDKGWERHQKMFCEHTFVDAVGVGTGVAPHIRRLSNGPVATSIKTSEKPSKESELGKFTIMRDQLYWLVREWLRTDPNSMLPPEEKLLEELRTPEYDIIRGKIAVTPKDVMKEQLHRSPDDFDALALTFAETEPDASRHSGGARPVIVEDAGGWT